MPKQKKNPYTTCTILVKCLELSKLSKVVRASHSHSFKCDEPKSKGKENTQATGWNNEHKTENKWETISFYGRVNRLCLALSFIKMIEKILKHFVQTRISIWQSKLPTIWNKTIMNNCIHSMPYISPFKLFLQLLLLQSHAFCMRICLNIFYCIEYNAKWINGFWMREFFFFSFVYFAVLYY